MLRNDLLKDPEFRDFCFGLNVLVDSREKQNDHILSWFTENNIDFSYTALPFGDYSLCSDSLDLTTTFALERKSDPDEFRRCLMDTSLRFEAELAKARCRGIDLTVFIENSSFDDFIGGDPYHSIPCGKYFRETRWLHHLYGTDFLLCSPASSGRLIYDSLLVRAWLLHKGFRP